MRVTRILPHKKVYSSNAYFIRGDYNAMEDSNTLIDTGSDECIIDRIEEIYTGVGKKRVDKIILTHNHFDHTGGIKAIKEKYKAKVFAFADFNRVDENLKGGDKIKIGDCTADIIHVPDHSHDSICILSTEYKAVFTGDITIIGLHAKKDYSSEFKNMIKLLYYHDIRMVYPGHGEPFEISKSFIHHSFSHILNKL